LKLDIKGHVPDNLLVEVACAGGTWGAALALALDEMPVLFLVAGVFSSGDVEPN